MNEQSPFDTTSTDDTPWYLRRGYLIAAAIALVAVLAIIIVMRSIRAHRGALPEPSLVTAVAPGRSPYTVSVSFTGAIVARFDVPIGVEGDGGRVAELLVEVGDHVRKGQVLAKLDTSVIAPQVASLAAALEQARADAALAAADYQRAAKIAETVAALSREEVEKRHTLVTTSAAHVRTAEAQLAEVTARFKRTEILAPDEGIVLTRAAELGQAVTAGSPPLFRIARGGEVEMRAQVSEQDLPRLKVGQDVAVTITGVPTQFPGKVRLLAAVIDPQTRLAEVKISLTKDPLLRPGAFAYGTAVVGSDVRPIVPQTALLSDATSAYVLIVDAHGRVERRNVRYGGAQPTGVVIIAGLTGDERVVSTAGAFLKEGETVRLAAPEKSSP